MQLTVTGRHVSVTEAMKEHAREKLGHAMRERPHINEIHVTMDVEKYRHRVELHVRGKNLDLFCHEETGDMYASIDGALVKLERQLRRYRERHSRKQQKQPPRFRAEEEAPDPDEPRIKQRLAMKPMFLDEALLQMKVDGHIFLAFINARTDAVNLLYRTGEGEVGHLAPKKIKGPDRAGKFRLRVFSEKSIIPDAKPRLLRKEVRSFDWSTPEEILSALANDERVFCFFLNREAENSCIIYKRAGGGYALIEPVI